VVATKLELSKLERVVIDTTVQSKAVAHPTDARLCHREHAMCGCARPTGKRRRSWADATPMPPSSGGRGANSNSCVPRLGRVIRGIRCKIAGNPRLTERFADLLALAVRARFAAPEIAPRVFAGHLCYQAAPAQQTIRATGVTAWLSSKSLYSPQRGQSPSSCSSACCP
jgi:transposase, IS5 family